MCISRHSLLLTTAVLLTAGAAQGADLPLPPPPVIAAFPAWYLRGDIGFSNQFVKNVLDTNPHAYDNVLVSQTSAFSSAGIFDIGFGYQFNNWFRTDFTAQYRGKSSFTGLDVVTGTGPNAGFVGTDNYTATKSELLFLANAYFDLGTWWCLTPFVGAGVGAARHQFYGMTDTGFPFGFSALGFASDNSTSKWTFAWALHAGVAYNVSNNVKIELAYRYLNFGSIDTPNVDCTAFGCGNINGNPNAFYSMTRFDSQDIKLGIRFLLCCEAPPPPPLIRKG